jgi:hypothetical protein
MQRTRHRKLMRNRAGNVSVGPLIEFLTALGQDVRITVKPTRKRVGGDGGGGVNFFFVMAGLVPAIHALLFMQEERRGCPAQGRA